MVRAVIYTDFDGVLNAFPDDKVLRRGGVSHTQWLKEGDPRKELYDSARAFPLAGNEQVRTGCGRFRVHWSRELASMMHELALSGSAELNWLTTWQPYCSRVLDPMLGWDPGVERTVIWYDPVTNERRLTGKLAEIMSRVRFERRQEESLPIVWIDDEECYPTSKTQIESLEPAAPVLMVRPDERIGISRRQWRLICDFLDDSSGFPSVSLDEEGTVRDHVAHVGL